MRKIGASQILARFNQWIGLLLLVVACGGSCEAGVLATNFSSASLEPKGMVSIPTPSQSDTPEHDTSLDSDLGSAAACSTGPTFQISLDCASHYGLRVTLPQLVQWVAADDSFRVPSPIPLSLLKIPITADSAVCSSFNWLLITSV